MAFSQEQYDALLDAIASGATTVSYSGKTIQYRSLQDMIIIAKVMQRHLEGNKGNKRSRLEFTRGRAYSGRHNTGIYW